MAAITLDTIRREFKGTPAVDDVSLTFADARLTVLVGPSGCGKTTLLRLIAGLDEPTSGNIFIGEQLVNDLPAWERNMAMVFQSYALYPHMTVADNIAFPLKAQRLNRNERTHAIAQAAAALGISELLRRKPRQLSGGQMQRVALARAIVRRPHAFLMDEPLSNLDALLRIETRAELKRLQRELGITTIYVTHDQEEAMTLADTLVVMRDGRAEQVGTPAAVYRAPHTLFVARFIGNPPMNLLPCHYNRAAATLAATGWQYAVPPQYTTALNAATSSDLVLGIRPEHIELVATTAPHAIPAEVYILEPLGRETLVTLVVGDTRVKLIAPPDLHLPLNSTVGLHFPAAHLHIFDSVTGAVFPLGD